MEGEGILFYGFCTVHRKAWKAWGGGIAEELRASRNATCAVLVVQNVFYSLRRRLRGLWLTRSLQNRQGNAMAVRFTVRENRREFRAMDHHEESKNAGNNMRTAIMKPERQAGQVVGMVGSGRAASDRAGVTSWRS